MFACAKFFFEGAVIYIYIYIYIYTYKSVIVKSKKKEYLIKITLVEFFLLTVLCAS